MYRICPYLLVYRLRFLRASNPLQTLSYHTPGRHVKACGLGWVRHTIVVGIVGAGLEVEEKSGTLLVVYHVMEPGLYQRMEPPERTGPC